MNGSSMVSERLKLLHSYSMLDLGTGAFAECQQSDSSYIFQFLGLSRLTEDISRVHPTVPCQPPGDVSTQQGDMQQPQEPAQPAAKSRRLRRLGFLA